MSGSIFQNPEKHGFEKSHICPGPMFQIPAKMGFEKSQILGQAWAGLGPSYAGLGPAQKRQRWQPCHFCRLISQPGFDPYTPLMLFTCPRFLQSIQRDKGHPCGRPGVGLRFWIVGIPSLHHSAAFCGNSLAAFAQGFKKSGLFYVNLIVNPRNVH